MEFDSISHLYDSKVYPNRLFTIDQRFSIGMRSGLCAGYSINWKFCLPIHSFPWGHTYIDLFDHYNPSVMIIDLVSLSPILCVLILYINGGTYNLKLTPKDRFFDKLFMAILFTSQSFWQKSAGGKSPKKYFAYFV